MSIEEKYDEVRQLINIGKEKGYLLYDEVNELLPSEITSSDELDDLFNTFGSAGIEVIDSDQKYLRDEKAIDRTAEGAEELELDLTRQRHRESVDVDFVDVESLRFEIDLVPFPIRKPHDLVLERRAIPRSDSLDLPVEERAPTNVAANEIANS